MFDFLLGKVEKKTKVRQWHSGNNTLAANRAGSVVSKTLQSGNTKNGTEEQKQHGEVGVRANATLHNPNSSTIEPLFYVPLSNSISEERAVLGASVAQEPQGMNSSHSDDLTAYLRALTDNTPPVGPMPVTRSVSEDRLEPSDSIEEFSELPAPVSRLVGHDFMVRVSGSEYNVLPFEPVVYEDQTEEGNEKPITMQIVQEHIHKEALELHTQLRRILFVCLTGKYTPDSLPSLTTVDKMQTGFNCPSHVVGISSSSLWPRQQSTAASLFTACHLGQVQVLKHVQSRFFSLDDALVAMLHKQDTIDVPVHMTASAFQRISARILQQIQAIPNAEGRTCMHLAAGANRASAMLLLLQFQDKRLSRGILKQKYLKNYIPQGCSQTLNVLKLGGPHCADPRGVQPIHLAALHGANEAVEVLLASGVNPNSTDNSEYTPLILASKAGHFRSAQLLLLAKASVNSRNIHGDSALHVATERAHEDVIALLCQHGACVSLPGSKNYTPVQLAALQNDLQTVQTQLQKKASVGDLVRVAPQLQSMDHGAHRLEQIALLLEST